MPSIAGQLNPQRVIVELYTGLRFEGMCTYNILASSDPAGSISHFWPVLPVSFVSALAATWLCHKIALKFGIVDKPDNSVKTHKEPIPYLGGIGIFIGFALGIAISIPYLRAEPYFDSALKWLGGICIGGVIACSTGLIDDISDIKPWHKILGQVLAGSALVAAGIRPEPDYFTNSFGYQVPASVNIFVGFIITMIFVLGATNSLNLLDGIDGLCASVTAVIAFGMLGLALLAEVQTTACFGNPVRIIIALAVLGSICGFWPLNKNPARIFMGDSGSLFLGFVMAGLMMLFAAAGLKWCLCSIMIFGLPILDTAVAFARRRFNKRPLFVADRGHIYDQMMDRGMSLNKTVAVCCGLAGVYVLIGLVMSRMTLRYALIVSAAVLIISGVVVWRKGYLKMEGLRGAI
jgi:UDP-GlcNAc:undecaprenyl-phosphate GlcNAc-1-phosphate transferase